MNLPKLLATVAAPGAPSRQQGIGLVEVLITIVILAVGLLGIAALQLMSKRSNFEATERSAATMLANFIVERMRANPAALATYAGTAESPAASVGGATIQSEPQPACASGATCVPAELAAHDRWELERLLDNNTSGLVRPTACITTAVPAASTDRTGVYTVTIVWRGSSRLTNANTANTCGASSGKYDDTSADNAYRRMVFVNSYITTAN